MNLDEIYSGGSDSIKAEDLQGKEVRLVITNTEVKEFEEEGKHGPYVAKKVVLHFRGTDKTMVLNKTNSYAIGGFLQTYNVDAWLGCSVTLYPTKTTFGTKMVDCIRVKAAGKPVAGDGTGLGEDTPF